MSSSPAQTTTFAAAGFARHTELLLACAPHLHVTAVARLWASSKELRAACRAVAQQEFSRLLQELLSELIRGRRLQPQHPKQRLASRAAALSWLCGMAGRAAVAAASQQCLDQGCYEDRLTDEDVRLLAAHGMRVTCQMVVDAARRGVDGAEVWLEAGVVDDAPALLLSTSMGDVERLSDLLYNTDQLPPQQQLLDALQLAANMMCSLWTERQGLALLEALLFPPSSLSSGASPDARKQQLLALVPAADLERLLSAAIWMDDSDGDMALAMCSCPAASELSGTAVLKLLEAAVEKSGNADLVSALGRLPGAAEMPLDKVAGLLTGGDQEYGNDDALTALLEIPRVQQAITADVADQLLRLAVHWQLVGDSSMVAVVSNTVVAGLVSTQGLAAAMKQCWMVQKRCGRHPWDVWQQLWSFPAAEEISPEQLHSAMLEAVISGCCDETIEQVLEARPFVQQHVDWHGLLQAVAHELRTTSSDYTKRNLRGQLVWLLSLQAGKLTVSEWQVTELLQAAIEARCEGYWLLGHVLRGKLSRPSVLMLFKHAVLHGADGTVMRDLCECPAAAGVPVGDLCDVARSLVQQQAGKQALQALRRLLLKVPGVPADVLGLFDGVA